MAEGNDVVEALATMLEDVEFGGGLASIGRALIEVSAPTAADEATRALDYLAVLESRLVVDPRSAAALTRDPDLHAGTEGTIRFLAETASLDEEAQSEPAVDLVLDPLTDVELATLAENTNSIRDAIDGLRGLLQPIVVPDDTAEDD